MQIEQRADRARGHVARSQREPLLARRDLDAFDLQTQSTSFTHGRRSPPRPRVYVEEEDSTVLRRGRLLESAVAQAYQEKHPNYKITKANHYYRASALRLGATPDFLLIDDQGRRAALQAKTVAPVTFKRSWTDETAPTWISLQTLTEAMLMRADYGVIAALVVDGFKFDLHEYIVPRHEAAERRIQDGVAKFWEDIAAGRTPEFQAADRSLIAVMYPKEEPGSVVDLRGDNELPTLLDERDKLKQEIDEKTDRQREIETRLMARMGAAESALINDWRVTFRQQQRKEFTVKATLPRVAHRQRTGESRMTNQHVITRDQSANAVTALRSDLEKMETQFRFALPAHIPPARFMRVVMTAVQNNPKLLKCTRQSFFNACMRCAQDGLLPDGREAALVPFAEDEDGKNKSDLAQYLPMIAGIRKKVRNSGLLRDWNVQVVQEGDQFDYQLGDNPFIRHKPSPTGGRARPVLFAYSIATYPDGTMSREVMNIDQIKDIQSKSKARRGPWSDPIFYPEMCRKTVAKLHAKQLPMSTDLDTVMRRDEELYDFRGERERSAAIPDQKPPPSVAAALDTFGNDFDEPIAAPMIDDKPASSAPSTQPPDAEGEHGGAQESEADSPAAAAATENAVDVRAVAYRRGQEARAAGQQRKAVPPEYREPGRLEESREWQRGWDEAPKTGASGPGSAPMLALATLAFLCASLMPAILYLNA